MKYGFITVDESRKAYKDEIRGMLSSRFEEVPLDCVDARNKNVRGDLERNGLSIHDWMPRSGEVGCWLSHFQAWDKVATMDEDLLVFEDDAIITHTFEEDLLVVLNELPQDFDYLALWVPDNQKQDYFYEVEYDERGVANVLAANSTKFQFKIDKNHISKVYQGYGMVATLYSPKGGAKLVELAREQGIWASVDLFMHGMAHIGAVNAFAIKPYVANLVKYDWPQTTIHNTGWYR